jgi:hypothetical protein
MPQKLRFHGKETQFARPEAHPRLHEEPQTTRPLPVTHGEQLGDQRVFTDELREVDNNNQPIGPVVGEHSGHSTLVRKGPGNARIYQSFGTFRLAGGLIAARTLFDLNNVPAGGLKAAITGGTDQYNKARGEINHTFPAPLITIFEIDLD